MKIHVFDNAQLAGKAAATLFASQLLRKPNSVFGFATGSTPLPLYNQLIEWYKDGLLDFSNAISFNLDEYIGLPVTHKCSYRFFMQENLFDHINLKETYVPNGMTTDPIADGKAYDEAIEKAGGLDLQLLGIGHDGHIGFNEPGDGFIQGTHVVTLTDLTIDMNARFFDNDRTKVPTQAITMGIGTILSAKEIVMIVTGADKANAVHGMLYGDIVPSNQASILRTHHNVTVILDKGAAEGLKK